jgi:hypothetical protein
MPSTEQWEDISLGELFRGKKRRGRGESEAEGGRGGDNEEEEEEKENQSSRHSHVSHRNISGLVTIFELLALQLTLSKRRGMASKAVHGMQVEPDSV